MINYGEFITKVIFRMDYKVNTYLAQSPILYFIFKKDFIYLFLEGKGGRKRGRETSMCGYLWCTPYWAPGLQPRHVP